MDHTSRLIAARLVHDLIGLCFLLERRYAPNIKWFGTAFAQLACAARLAPILAQVLEAPSWEARQAHLADAYQFVAKLHNALGITGPLDPQVSHFHNRPFLVLHADRFATALRAAIKSPPVLALPEHLGSIDQFVDSTDALRYLERLKALYNTGEVA